MRILITLLLASVMALGYLKLNETIAREITVSVDTLDLSEYKVEIARLEAVVDYSEIVNLPLFDETRRPPVVKVKAVAKIKPVEKRLQIQALGIAVNDSSILAVVKNLRTGKIIRLRFGDEIDGWTLKEVAEDHFIFERNGAEREIKFKGNQG